jgi:hypothetical protein
MTLARLPRLIACAAFIAAVSAAVYWLQQQQTAARRLAAWEEQQAELAEPEALDQVITLESRQWTLAEFAALIESKSGLDVEIDAAEIGRIFKGKTPENIQFRVPSGSLTLRAALRNALETRRLGTYWHNNKLVISSSFIPTMLKVESMLSERLLTVVYPLPQPEPAGMDAEAWFLTLARYAYGPGGYIEEVPGALVVITTAEDHRRIRQVIDAICSLDRNSSEPASIPPPAPGDIERRILAAMDGPAEIRFVEMPLADAVSFLASRHDIPLVLCVNQLDAAGIPHDTPVTKELKGISFRSALSLLLKDLDLTFIIQDQAVMITTPDDAESHLRNLAYAVHDLVDTPEGADFAPLIQLITASLAPHSWDDVGGPGACRGIGDGWLLVEQTDEVHRQVAHLLSQLRRAFHPDAPRSLPLVPPSPADDRIHTALDRRTPIEFHETPLKDAVAYLQDQLGIPIVLNVKALNDGGINVDSPITASYRSGRAATQLELLLEQLDLTCLIRDEVLQITTQYDAESHLETRLYNVRSLAAIGLSPEQLCQLVSRAIERQTWEQEGGAGSIGVYRGMLVVSHKREIQEQVDCMLQTLAEYCLPSKPISIPGIGIPLTTRLDANRRDELRTGSVRVRWAQLSLQKALEVVSAEHGLSFALDYTVLPSHLDRPISLAFSGNLHELLNRMLRTMELDFLVREHAILITTPERAQRTWEVRLYGVEDLARSRGGLIRLCDELRLAFPDEWKRDPHAYGTPLDMRAWAQPIEPKWLVVRTSQSMHEQIQDWLEQLRTGRMPAREAARQALDAVICQQQVIEFQRQKRERGDPFEEQANEQARAVTRRGENQEP